MNGCQFRRQQLYTQANASFRAERYAEALAITSQGLRQNSASSDLYWKFRLLNAQILLGKREALHARSALQFQFPPAFRTPQNLSRHALSLGFAATLLQNYSVAQQQLNLAASHARAAADPELQAEIQNRQGVLAIAQGQFDQAGEFFRLALAFASAHRVPWLAINATGNVGFRLMRLSRYEEAIPWFQQAVAAARQAGAPESEARNVGNLGWCYYRIGESDKAVEAFQKAEASFERTGNRGEQQTWLGNIGSIYLDRVEYATAATYYQRALELARALGYRGAAASWLTNLARISIETGDLDAAERYNNEGLTIKRELHLASAEGYSALNAARIAFNRGQFADAETTVRGILRSAQSDPALRLRAYDELAIVLAATGHYPAAETAFRAAIAEVERERTELLTDDFRRAYLASLIGFYQDYVEFLMDRGKTAEALEIADSSHARTLHDRTLRRAADFKKLAAASGSTLLSYSLGARKSYLWIVTPRGIKAVVLPRESEVRPLIAAYDKSIEDMHDPLAGDAGNTGAGPKLYQLLIAPAMPFMGKTGRVIVVPDGLLYSLNFETLPVPGPAPHYWIEDAAVSIAPALGLLRVAGGARAVSTGSLLLIGDPVSPDPEFPKLAYAAQEMASISRSLPQARKVVLTGPAARPDAWAQAQPSGFDLIHFTAHATASRDEPLESAVILSRDASGGFKLHARDVVKTPVNAWLVTVSACRSAGTRIYAGEGLVGLAWAFLEAGAHSVIAGLWDVNDASGAKTMERLYGGLAAGKRPVDALREAKLEMIHAGGVYRKPWYWGAFQLFSTDMGN